MATIATAAILFKHLNVEENVYDGVGRAVERGKALYKCSEGHAMCRIDRLYVTIYVKQIVHKVRTPAKYKR